MKTPNKEKEQEQHSSDGDGDGDDDADDDRKPPAREIRIVRNDNEQSNPQEFSCATTTPSVEGSLASNSISVGWTGPWSPVARAQGYYSTPDKQGTKRTQAVPSLAAATPTTPYSPSIDKPQYPHSSALVSSSPSQPTNSTVSTIQSLQHQIYLWLATMAVAVAVLFYLILPTAALYTLVFMSASTGMLSHTMLQTARQWYHDTIVTGAGLGPYLPDSLYTLLTQTSWHDYLTDDAFMVEHRHLILYFLPLSEQQLEAAIARLAPAHRDNLYRPGRIGQALLGDDPDAWPMRWLMGSGRHPQQQQQQQQQQDGSGGGDNNRLRDDSPLPQPPPQRRLLYAEEDTQSSSSDLGLDVTSEDMAGGLSDGDAQRVARRLRLTAAAPQTPVSSPNRNNNTDLSSPMPRAVVARAANTETDTDDNDEDQQDYANQELDVLIDAMFDAYYGAVWNPIRDYVRTSIVAPTAWTIRRYTIRTAETGVLVASGVGLYGLLSSPSMYTTAWPTALASLFAPHRGYNDNNNNNISTHRRLSMWSTWGVTLLGGTAAGVALYARRQQRQRNAETTSAEKDDACQKKSTKN